jgi:hypothetical protein
MKRLWPQCSAANTAREILKSNNADYWLRAWSVEDGTFGQDTVRPLPERCTQLARKYSKLQLYFQRNAINSFTASKKTVCVECRQRDNSAVQDEYC